MKYTVKYRDVVIGSYNVISNDHVEYVIDKSGINKLEKEGYQLYPDLVKNYSGKSFPFLDNRIKNCFKYENEKIGYHTDPIALEIIFEKK